MKKSLCFLFFLVFLTFTAQAQTPTKQQLLELDLGWKKALLESDVAFLEYLMADEFVWVYNHEGSIDGKDAIVSRAKRIQTGQVDSITCRTSRVQQVVIFGSTGVVSGFTVVERGPSPATYHFMRTYAMLNGKIKLLSNHTTPKESWALPTVVE